jgi:DNA-binding transcriptional LysR family regulator
MEVFARVFELGGFSAAARALRMTPSAISKLVGRLETRLGARLVNRSTRTLQFTAEGRLFYERSIRLLADMDEVERSVAEAEIPKGKIRVSANIPVGRQLLLPIVPAFLEAYAARAGLDLTPDHEVENISMAVSMIVSTRGLALLPLYARNLLPPSVVSRPLQGEVPTIDLAIGYNRANTSSLLKAFLSRVDELIARGSMLNAGSPEHLPLRHK